MEEREEDVRLGASRYPEKYPLGTAAAAAAAGGNNNKRKEYIETPATPLYEPQELSAWSFYRAGLTEFMASFLFLYISMLTVIGVARNPNKCSTVGVQGIAWGFGSVMFALVYSTAGISGGHINPAVTFGLFLARKLSLTRTIFYMVMQCLGATCGAGMLLGLHATPYAVAGGGGGNGVSHNKVNVGYTKGDGLGAEIMGTFVLVYTVFSAVDAKTSTKDSHIPKPRKSIWSKHLGTEGINILAPLPIGFAVFLVHLATIPITGTGINPARSLGAAIVFSKDHAWIDHWIFWVGPFIGAALAAMYDQVILKEMPFNAGSTRRAYITV